MGHIAGRCLPRLDMTDSKIAAMGKVEVREAEHIVVSAAAG